MVPGRREARARRRGRSAGEQSLREQFAALIREHDHNLRMLAYRLLGDRDAMDDVLQEAYLRAYQGLPGFRGEAAAGTWLYRITYNICLDHLRADKRRKGTFSADHSLEELAESGWEPEAAGGDPAEGAPLRADLALTLDTLSPEHKAAVLLVDAMGHDYARAGEILGIREGTLASRLHQARSILRKALTDDTREAGR